MNRREFIGAVVGAVASRAIGGEAEQGRGRPCHVALPPWAEERLSAAAKRFAAWRGDDPVVAFTLMTDVHAHTMRVEPNFADPRCHPLFAQALAARVNADFLADLGDMDFDMPQQPRPTPEETTARLESVRRIYAPCARPVLFAMGNHDHGWFDPATKRRTVPSARFGATFNGLAAGHGHALVLGPDATWGYYDVPEKGFRAIFLNTSDEGYYGYSRAQLAFLRRALDEVPANGHAVILQHYCAVRSIGHTEAEKTRTAAVREEEFLDMLKAFVRRRPGVLAGVFCGDSHFDAGLDWEGVHFTVSQGYGRNVPSNLPYGAVYTPFARDRDMLFELVGVKCATREVRVFRVGAGGALRDRGYRYASAWYLGKGHHS